MTKNEKLRDREQERAGLIADRDNLIRTCNSRPRRKQMVHQAVEDIRIAKLRIAKALAQIKEARSASQIPNGSIYLTIDQRNAKIRALNQEIVTLRNEARIEKAFELLRQINAEEKELGVVGDPDSVTEEEIVS